jgi:putative autotransporter adhesin-like protein
MVHKLILVAAIGLATSAACIGTAAAIGGASLSDGMEGFSLFDGRPRCEANTAFTARSRDLDWDDSDHAGVNLMGQASYTPGTDDRVHASGDPQVLAHLRVRRGTVELDCRGWRDRTRELAITLPGREFKKFEVTGGRLMIARLDQPRVSIEIAGSGKVQAAGGKLDQVGLEIAGSGEMNLGEFTANRGKMEIAGSGTFRATSMRVEDLKVEIAGSGRAEIGQITARTTKAEIAGSGTVIAAGAIDDLKIEIAGSGRADFGKVASRRADVDIGGHGEVDIAPTDYAKIDIGGSADVNLHSNPKQLETDIGGSGRIHRLAPGT